MKQIRNVLIFLVLGCTCTAIGKEAPPSEAKPSKCPPLKFFSRPAETKYEVYIYAVIDQPYEGNPDDVNIYDIRGADPKTGCMSRLGEPCIIDGGILQCSDGSDCTQMREKQTPRFEEVENKPFSAKTRHPVVGLCKCPDGTTQNKNETGCIPAAKFGARCDENLPCEGENVDCVNNRCGCPPIKSFTRLIDNGNYSYAVRDERTYDKNPNELELHPRTYDEKQKSCVSMEGGVCSHAIPEWRILCPKNENCWTSFPSNRYEETYHTQRFADETERYPILGQCQCDDKHIRDAKTQKCKPMPVYGEACRESEKCFGNGLKCINERCTCENEDSRYDAEKNRCILQINAKCDYSDYCGPNADCKYSNEADGSFRRCKCVSGYESFNGTCLGGHLSRCEKSSQCHPQKFLKCVDGYCKCGDSANQIYNKEKSQCEGIVGSKCLTEGGPSCTEMAQCRNGICKCSPRTAETPDRKCVSLAGFDQSCSAFGCNFRKGLACIDGKCKCFDSQYEAIFGECVGGVGSYCGKVEQVGWSESNYSGQKHYFIECVEGTVCKAVEEGRPRCKI